MIRADRRRFLSSLGLGVGATVLNPIANQLFSEAFANNAGRRRLLLYVVGVSNEALWAPGGNRYSEERQILAADDFDWPDSLAPLASKRRQMLAIDNLHCDLADNRANDFEINHGLGYGLLSCVRPAGSPKDLAPPLAQTIDQYFADRIGDGTTRKSVLVGASHHSFRRNEDEEMNIFASGPRQPLAHVVKASVLYERLFSSMGSEGQSVVRREQKLTDLLKDDIARLRARLGSAERERLETYQAAFEDFDQRRDIEVGATCDSGSSPGPRGTQEKETEDLVAMAALALRCGMTNVVAVNVGAGNNHNGHMPYYSTSRQFEVHGTDSGVNYQRDFIEPLTDIWQKNAGFLSDAMDALEATPEGDGTALDGTLVAMMVGRGIRDGNRTHHADIRTGGRFPLILGGRPPGMRLDGRYIAYDRDSHGMVDFWKTCLNYMGVPANNFAPGAHHERGRLTELG